MKDILVIFYPIFDITIFFVTVIELILKLLKMIIETELNLLANDLKEIKNFVSSTEN